MDTMEIITNLLHDNLDIDPEQVTEDATFGGIFLVNVSFNH